MMIVVLIIVGLYAAILLALLFAMAAQSLRHRINGIHAERRALELAWIAERHSKP